MDPVTLQAYDVGAAGYCQDWLTQPPPQDVQRLWQRYFQRGGATLDVGSGSGRDVDWMNRNGYPCAGVDASDGLLAQARERFPQWRFERAVLPDLAGVAEAAYDNVVCETVIMHLPVTELPGAIAALRRILAPQGTLYLSWRVTAGADARDAAGRLYGAFPVDQVRAALAGSTLLYDAEAVSESSGKRVHRLVVRQP